MQVRWQQYRKRPKEEGLQNTHINGALQPNVEGGQVTWNTRGQEEPRRWPPTSNQTMELCREL
jgi:hypothetical protein